MPLLHGDPALCSNGKRNSERNGIITNIRGKCHVSFFAFGIINVTYLEALKRMNSNNSMSLRYSVQSKSTRERSSVICHTSLYNGGWSVHLQEAFQASSKEGYSLLDPALIALSSRLEQKEEQQDSKCIASPSTVFVGAHRSLYSCFRRARRDYLCQESPRTRV